MAKFCEICRKHSGGEARCDACNAAIKEAENEFRDQELRLANEWVLYSSNAGTFGPAEAVSKVGTSDPKFAERNVYEQVGTGKIRTTGPEQDNAPGRMRHFTKALREKKQELVALRAKTQAHVEETVKRLKGA